MDLRTQLVQFEGYRTRAYPDPKSPLALAMQDGLATAGLSGAPWTIGIGHTGPEVKPGLVWTDNQIMAAFNKDVSLATARLTNRMPQLFYNLNDPRRAVVIGMAFQLGVDGVLGFRNTLAAVVAGRYNAAAAGMLASKWHRDTPSRCETLSRQMASGVWQ